LFLASLLETLLLPIETLPCVPALPLYPLASFRIVHILRSFLPLGVSFGNTMRTAERNTPGAGFVTAGTYRNAHRRSNGTHPAI
jgi:hypothetical protein